YVATNLGDLHTGGILQASAPGLRVVFGKLSAVCVKAISARTSEFTRPAPSGSAALSPRRKDWYGRGGPRKLRSRLSRSPESRWPVGRPFSPWQLRRPARNGIGERCARPRRGLCHSGAPSHRGYVVHSRHCGTCLPALRIPRPPRAPAARPSREPRPT